MSTPLAAPGEQPLDSVKDPADRSILIGIVATVALHILLIVLAPKFGFDEFSGIHTGISVNQQDHGKTFDFELTPPELKEQEQKRDPFQFVDTNPDAPANEPDKTDKFSNRNQQSAQEVAAKERDPENRPSVKSDDTLKDSNAIVSGELQRLRSDALPQRTSDDTADQKEEKLRMAQVPLSGFDKSDGKSEDGVASNSALTKAPTNNAEQNVEGVDGAKDLDGSLTAASEAHRAQPKQRPRLSSAMPSVVTNRVRGTNNIGILGQDARWSEYGEYLGEVFEIIAAQWLHTVEESRVSPAHGSYVLITFKLNSKGDVDIIAVEDGNNAGKQAVFTCQHAIQARQPYRKWPEQMITVLGEEQTLQFGFYY